MADLRHDMQVRPRLTITQSPVGNRLRVRAAVRIDITTDKRSDDTFARAKALTNPYILRTIAKQLAVATVIEAYKRRFTAAKKRMIDLRVIKGGRSFRDGYTLKEVLQIARYERDIAKANADEKAKRLTAKEARERVDTYRARINLIRGDTSTNTNSTEVNVEDGVTLTAAGTKMGSGQFKSEMMRVYQEIFTETELPTGVGFGDRKVIDAINTPAHKPTSSEYQMMWKQLEFGTGVYAVNAGGYYGRTGGVYKESDGSWWYGRIRNGKHTGLHLKGTRPGAWFRQPNSTPYPQDAFNFEAAFHLKMADYFAGR